MDYILNAYKKGNISALYRETNLCILLRMEILDTKKICQNLYLIEDLRSGNHSRISLQLVVDVYNESFYMNPTGHSSQ